MYNARKKVTQKAHIHAEKVHINELTLTGEEHVEFGGRGEMSN